jgi:type II secretory pathway pseudopilin PulG
VTLVEIMIGLALLGLLLMAAYRLFFSEVRAIRVALEHIGVNENARAFLTQFGHDVRTASKVTFPWPIRREDVRTLTPAGEGIVCSLEKQMFDFAVKPPDPKFLRRVKIDWRLKKNGDGTFDLYRDIVSEIPPRPGLPTPFKGTRQVCGGVKELTVFSTLRKPPKLSSFGGLPFKNFLEFEPYHLDGTGAFLVHVRAIFVREGTRAAAIKDQSAQIIRTCFALRGRPNGVNP